MRFLIPLLFYATLCSIGAVAQESSTNAPAKIPASQAKDFVGSEKTVTGKVAEVNVAERLIRINFDKPFPNQTFTAVIPTAVPAKQSADLLHYFRDVIVELKLHE